LLNLRKQQLPRFETLRIVVTLTECPNVSETSLDVNLTSGNDILVDFNGDEPLIVPSTTSATSNLASGLNVEGITLK
jgi:hypothetical protein